MKVKCSQVSLDRGKCLETLAASNFVGSWLILLASPTLLYSFRSVHMNRLGVPTLRSSLYTLLVLVLMTGLLPVISVSARPALQAANVALNKPTTCSPAPQFP